MRVPGLRIDVYRLQQSIDELANISESPPPVVTRILFSKADLRAREFVKNLCRQARLALGQDAVGNNFAPWKGKNAELPPVATGLHMDAALAALTNGAPNHPLIDV